MSRNLYNVANVMPNSGLNLALVLGKSAVETNGQ